MNDLLDGRRAARLLALGLLAGGCTPDVQTTGPASSGAGGGSSTTSSTNGAGSTNAASATAASTTAAQCGASSAASSTGASMSPTCSQPCDQSGGAMCETACNGFGDPACDCDDDGEIIDTAACKTAHPTAAIDCYDCSASAKHGTANYFIVDRGDGDFDFNCSNLEEPQYTENCGEGGQACTKPFRFDVVPGCGKVGNLFACTTPVLQCQKGNTSNPTPQACH
jgi:hypothetical protein